MPFYRLNKEYIQQGIYMPRTETPRDVINKSKSAQTDSTSAAIRYPLDIDRAHVKVYLTPYLVKRSPEEKAAVNNTAKQYETDAPQDAESVAKSGSGLNVTSDLLTGGTRAIPTVSSKIVAGQTIVLPVPEQIQDKLSISYSAMDLGVSAAMFQAGQDLGTSDAAPATKGMGAYIGRNAVSQFNQELGAIFSLLASNVPNPYSTLLFKNVEQRNFDFSYTFSPTSNDESRELRRLINSLRYLSLPREDGYFLEFPHEFELSFVGTDYLFAMSRGYITDLQATYGASGGIAFFDETAAPQMVKLSFTFREIYPLNKTLIDLSNSASMKPGVKGNFGDEVDTFVSREGKAEQAGEAEKKLAEEQATKAALNSFDPMSINNPKV
jgi:hypothetical protein